MPITVAPGSVVQVRDEEWLVSTVEQTDDGQLLTVQGLSDLVRGTTAKFYEHLDNIIPLDPHDATPVADASPHYRDARLWLEATLRKTPIPLGEPTLAAVDGLGDFGRDTLPVVGAEHPQAHSAVAPRVLRDPRAVPLCAGRAAPPSKGRGEPWGTSTACRAGREHGPRSPRGHPGGARRRAGAAPSCTSSRARPRASRGPSRCPVGRRGRRTTSREPGDPGAPRGRLRCSSR